MTAPSRELTLSELLTLHVRTTDDTALGRVRDVRIGQLSGEPEIDLVRLEPRHGPPLAVPWRSIRLPDTAGPEATLLAGSGELGRYVAAPRTQSAPTTGSSALWLARDVLDSQVVDLSGSRLARVSDVLMVLEDAGALRLFAVDLGFGALIGRVGLGALGRRMPSVVVAWEDLYLASAGGHRSELAVAADRLQRLDPQTVAQVVARLRIEQASDVLQAIEPTRAAIAIAASHHDLRHHLLRSLPPPHRAAVLRAVPDTLTPELMSLARRDRGRGRRLLRLKGWRVRRPEERRR